LNIIDIESSIDLFSIKERTLWGRACSKIALCDGDCISNWYVEVSSCFSCLTILKSALVDCDTTGIKVNTASFYGEMLEKGISCWGTFLSSWTEEGVLNEFEALKIGFIIICTQIPRTAKGPSCIIYSTFNIKPSHSHTLIERVFFKKDKGGSKTVSNTSSLPGSVIHVDILRGKDLVICKGERVDSPILSTFIVFEGVIYDVQGTCRLSHGFRTENAAGLRGRITVKCIVCEIYIRLVVLIGVYQSIC